MFKIFISELAYQGVTSSASSGRANLQKLLKQQPYQLLTVADNERLKSHPEDLLKNPSALYILDVSSAEALGIQKIYGVMCLCSALSNEAEHKTYYYALNGKRMERCMGVRNRLFK